MYYLLKRTEELDIVPRMFGKDLRANIEQLLRSKVEGKCTTTHGYILIITSIEDISRGLIRKDSSGMATFEILYQCIACRPFKGEVMDCMVNTVNKMGFFASAGPLTLFVSTHLLPMEYEFDSYNNCFAGRMESMPIKANSHVRVRIVGIKVDPQEIFCIASMKDDYLGCVGGD